MAPWLLLATSLLAPPPTVPITLDDALTRARTNNLDIRIATERLEEGRLLSKKAWGVLLPSASAALTWTLNDKAIEIPFFVPNQPEPVMVTLQQKTQLGANVRVNWPLLNGRSIPLLQNAYSQVEYGEVSFLLMTRAIQRATILSYYNVVAAQRQVEIATRNLESARHHETKAKERVALGQVPALESVRAESTVAAAEQSLVSGQGALRMTRLALAVIMGEGGDDQEPPTYEATLPPEPEEAPPPDLESAHSQRLELRQSRLRLEMAERSVTETWMKFLPMVLATGTWMWSDTEGFSGRNTQWNLGLTLQWNFFEGGLTFWETFEREHQEKAAALEIEKTRQTVGRQVREAQVTLESSQARIAVAHKRVELAARAHEMIEAQYEAGLATQLDLLDAQRAQADAETAQNLAELELRMSKLELAHALGEPLR